ncbi:MAG: lycopene cyclase family protein [Pseudomonadota bacterium]
MGAPNKTDTTALILGGGCAGLHLGAALGQHGIDAQIIEPRTAYRNDRTWSFWQPVGAVDPAVTVGRWQSWSVQGIGQDQSVIRRSDELAYVSLGADRVYDRLLGRIADAPSIELHQGTKAEATPVWQDEARHWVVSTSRGDITARYVFDSRPPAVTPGTYGQYFLGVEVRTERPAFDPTTAQIMHFRPVQEGARGTDAIDFLYVLPFADNHALVEVTRFTAVPPDPAALRRWLEAELAQQLDGTIHEIAREETGFIPMVVARPKQPMPGAPGYCPIGIAGGAARASTGYAFTRIVEATQALADQVRAGQPQPGLDPDGTVTRWMDQVFLSVLQRYPERAPALFTQLFAAAPKDRVERFLSGSRALSDRFAVMRSLPTGPFLREALGLAGKSKAEGTT